MFFQYILSKIYRDFRTYNGETPPGHLTLDCAREYGIWLVRLSLELEKLAFTLVRWEILTKNVEFNFFERSYIPPRTGLSEDTKFNVKVVSTRKIPQNYLTKVKNKVMLLNLLGGEYYVSETQCGAVRVKERVKMTQISEPYIVYYTLFLFFFTTVLPGDVSHFQSSGTFTKSHTPKYKQVFLGRGIWKSLTEHQYAVLWQTSARNSSIPSPPLKRLWEYTITGYSHLLLYNLSSCYYKKMKNHWYILEQYG